MLFLVALPAGMRSSSGILMASALVLNGVINLDLALSSQDAILKGLYTFDGVAFNKFLVTSNNPGSSFVYFFCWLRSDPDTTPMPYSSIGMTRLLKHLTLISYGEPDNLRWLAVGIC